MVTAYLEESELDRLYFLRRGDRDRDLDLRRGGVRLLGGLKLCCQILVFGQFTRVLNQKLGNFLSPYHNFPERLVSSGALFHH